MPITIRQLAEFDQALLIRIGGGYTSHATYVVGKTESAQETTFRLERVPLDEPYVKAWPEDADTNALYTEIVGQGWSRAACEGDTIVGLAIAEVKRWNRTFWIWEFHVAESHRGRGIGRQLMDAMEDVARAADCRVMVCETQNTNAPAIDFYRAVGYEIGALDLSYYTNEDVSGGEVAIFMKRKVGAKA